ncbi:MAG TPA: MFS transporter [Terriglobales bacterium]|nr:MFS transporter [Terriglobales bacterium]
MLQQQRSAPARILALASLGSALEYYDFVIFVFLTPVIGQLFFSPGIPAWVRETQTFGLFAAGYLVRPLGGIVMAHFGDTRGRKRMFTLSVLLMAIPTFAIALLPTYSAIGIAAPLLLLVMRMLQGTALGGEAPGGWVFSAEHANPKHVGVAVGLLTSGLSLGILLGSIVASALNLAFAPAQIADGMWRLPFLIGGVFGLTAMYLRRWLEETPVFEAMRSEAALCRELPVRAVLREHRAAVALSLLSTSALMATIVVVILMTPALLHQWFGLPSRVAQLANLAGSAGLVTSCVVAGAAVDRFGLRKVAFVVYGLLIAATYALYLGAGLPPAAVAALYLMAGLGAGSAVLTPILMVQAFPPAVRFTGVSFSYNVGCAVIGGITPLVVSWLAHLDRFVPAHYVAVAGVIGLAVPLLLSRQELRRASLAGEAAA